ncbi:MAG: hypothetical protein J5858_12995 [Lentisphaeria bacterium]|nr:hypothetical protein [Lentisphaeria bacterium]
MNLKTIFKHMLISAIVIGGMAASAAEAVKPSSKIMIAFYSCTGNTRAAELEGKEIKLYPSSTISSGWLPRRDSNPN